jgi:hypothetical protein
MPNKYSEKNFSKNLQNLQKKQKKQNQSGGENANKRSFKIVELNGKLVDFGHLTIKKKTSSGNPGPGPSAVAKKALSSIAKYLKTNKSKIDVKFMIQEITRGPSQYKIYGPYHGKYRKYSAKEMKEKEIKTKDGKIIKIEYQPIVKLVKKKNKKGG